MNAGGGGRIAARCLGLTHGNSAPEPRTRGCTSHHINGNGQGCAFTTKDKPTIHCNWSSRNVCNRVVFAYGAESNRRAGSPASGTSSVCGLEPTLFRFLFPSCPSIYWISCVHAGTCNVRTLLTTCRTQEPVRNAAFENDVWCSHSSTLRRLRCRIRIRVLCGGCRLPSLHAHFNHTVVRVCKLPRRTISSFSLASLGAGSPLTFK